MTDLFNSPVLWIEQPSAQLNYQITDPQGTPLAHVTQVAGNQPKSGFGRFFQAYPDKSRVVVQVARPDGTPVFFVDRAQGSGMSVILPPCTVVAPDGTLIGRVEHNSQEYAKSFLEGGALQAGGATSPRPGRIGTFHEAHQLFDAQQQLLCRMTWEQIELRRLPSNFEQRQRATGGRFAVFTDMNDTQIARLDTVESDGDAERFALQIGFKLPEPLRTLVIAAPLAVDLMAGS